MVTGLIFNSAPWVLPAVMFVVLALAVELPYRFLKPERRSVSGDDPVNGIQSGLITLSAFVLGLSFAQASQRFDLRRELVVKEANAIGTTWLRADQLPPLERKTFRKTLTQYTAERLEVYETPIEQQSVDVTLQRSFAYQDTMWATVSAAVRKHPNDLGLSLLMQTLNDTIDVSAEQLQALRSHVPTAMFVLTLFLVTLSAFATGVRFAHSGSRPALMTASLVLAYVIVIGMNVDYDLPQRGVIKVNLEPLRIQLQSMKGPG
jgi:hypothetical protein